MKGSTPRSSSRRGQTEPLAAIVAVSTFTIAFGIYVVFLSGVPMTEERKLAGPTNDRVWQNVSDSDVYRPSQTNLADEIYSSDVPDGHYAYVAVVTYRQTGKTVEDQVYLRGNGSVLPVREDYYEPDGDVNPDATLPPESADVSEESIEVAISRGRVRGGLLHVEVWE